MTRLVLSYRRQHDDALPSFRVIDQFPAVIGRALDCDVILGDPYVAPRQAVIRHTEQGWEISDLSDKNPTHLNGRAVAAGAWRPLQSGDHIVFGRSEMTAYAPDHAVAPTLPLPREGGLSAIFARSWVSGSIFVLTLLLAAGFSYLDIWSAEPAMTAALVATSAFIIMVIWAGLWSVVGRLTVNRSRFVMQLGLVSAYMAASLVTSVLMQGLDFLLGGNWIAQGMALVVQMLLLSALAYGSLGIATAITRRKRVQGAAGFAGGLLLCLMSLEAIGAMAFSAQPPFSSSLSPALARFAPATTAESFMTDSEKLFDHTLFTRAAPASDAAQQEVPKPPARPQKTPDAAQQ